MLLLVTGTDNTVLEETPFVYQYTPPMASTRPLLLPDRIIRVTDNAKTCLCSARNKQGYWVTANSFCSIQVSPEMIRDHFPNVLYNNMKSLWKQYVQFFYEVQRLCEALRLPASS